MHSTQAISNPFGITTFGSATNRVAPDIVSIKCAVSRLELKPSDAFAKAKHDAHAVQNFLRAQRISDFGTARVTLSQQNRFVNGENRFVGYQAKVVFRVVLSDLDRTDEVVGGLVTAGANEIESVTFETTRLKEVRAEARALAIAAALEKAQVYCAAAKVALGRVLHIEDADPRAMIGELARGGGASAGDDGFIGGTFDPGLIAVSASVLVAYEIRPRD